VLDLLNWRTVCAGIQLWLAVCCLLTTNAFATTNDAAVRMDDPIAYCLDVLEHCTSARQVPLDHAAAQDAFRELRGDSAQPVTLVFQVPPSNAVHSTAPAMLMLSAGYGGYCSKFDVGSQPPSCVEHSLLRVPVPKGATRLTVQQTRFTDTRLEMPRMMYGTDQELQNQTVFERDVIVLLVGWYALMTVGAAAQMLIRFNRIAALCMALVAFALLFRTMTVGVYGFSGLEVFETDTNRRIELGSLILMCLGGTMFYGAFIRNKLLRARRLIQVLCVLAMMAILLVQSPAGWYVVLRLVQWIALASLLCMTWQVVLTFKALDVRRRIVIFIGVSCLVVSALIDLVCAFLGLPFLGHIGLLPYGFAVECLCQIVLLAFTNEAAQHKIAQQQLELFAAQSALLESTQHSEKRLKIQVTERTAELQSSNAKLQIALQESEQARRQAEISRIFAEESQQTTHQTLEKLQQTQAQLIQAEKNASLGLLVSNVAHEMNTPMGAVKSSGEFIADTLESFLTQLPHLTDILHGQTQILFLQLVRRCQLFSMPLSTRQERALTKALALELTAAHLDDPSALARILVKLNAHEMWRHFEPLFQHAEREFLLSAAVALADLINGTRNINSAVAKVSRIVFALKELSGHEVAHEVTQESVQDGLDQVLSGFKGPMHDIQLLRHYHVCEPLRADHAALRQVWTHLMMNALQAMPQNGKLEVGLRQVDGFLEIQIQDHGVGMSEVVLGRIFDPFFTTRTAGEGSGMGLAIVKNIIDKHQGSIEVQSSPGKGSCFTVFLPCNADQ
jgi:signal transduction histidine kinase